MPWDLMNYGLVVRKVNTNLIKTQGESVTRSYFLWTYSFANFMKYGQSRPCQEMDVLEIAII